MKTLLFIITSFICSSAHSTPIHIADPDSIWAGPSSSVIINDSFNNLTLSANLPAYIAGNDVLALGGGVNEVPGWAPAVFGHTLINFPNGGCSGCWSFTLAELRADFSTPTNYVSVDFIDIYEGVAIINAYNIFDELIATTQANLLGNPATNAQRVSISVFDALSSISYIVTAADSGTYGVIDRISWNNTIPNPPIALLFGIGIFFLYLAYNTEKQ